MASICDADSWHGNPVAPEALLFQTGYLNVRSAQWCDGISGSHSIGRLGLDRRGRVG